jgi:hypothetical protein
MHTNLRRTVIGIFAALAAVLGVMLAAPTPANAAPAPATVVAAAPAPAAAVPAYPGPDGYDSGYCLAVTGMKMGYSNWFSGTGQVVAIDVNDTTSSDSLRRVQWSSTISTFTATTSLARIEIYRANKYEEPLLTMYTNGGKQCSVRLDG